ncbi:MAG: KEOPS complex subunit Pcc1 [Nanoarchaeota archaeon]
MHDIITIEDTDSDALYRCMIPEKRALNAKRFRYRMEKQEDKLVFHIEADDTVALRAARSSITKLVRVFKKCIALSDKDGLSRKDSGTAAT